MINIPAPAAIDDRLARSFQKIRNGRRPIYPFRVQLRASSFPICPRKYHIYRRLPAAKRPTEDDTFIRDAATLEGTALHMVLQKWFGIELPHHAYGNWGCYRCKKLVKHALGMQCCPSCGQEMVYVEFEIVPNQHVPFTGHIDMILRFYDITYLVDFKGSSLDKIARYKLEGPKLDNYLQTNGYANAINLGDQDVGDVRIDKIVIIYVDRGRPWIEWLPFVMPVSKRVYRETVALVGQARRSVETMTVPLGICRTAHDSTARWCECRDLCFSEMLETQLHDTAYPEDKRPQQEVEGLLRLRAKRSTEGNER